MTSGYCECCETQQRTCTDPTVCETCWDDISNGGSRIKELKDALRDLTNKITYVGNGVCMVDDSVVSKAMEAL